MPFDLKNLPAIAMAVVFSIVFLGMGAYILTQIGAQGNITTISNLANQFTSWGTTWIPIVLVVVGGALVIGTLLKGFGGR